MMDKLWTIERNLWLEDENFVADHMATSAVMVFPPAGILKGEALVEGLRGAPRWRSVEMESCEHVLHEGCAVLAYRATAERDGEKTYKALCMSVYEQRNDAWKIVAHQQTPV